MIHGGDIEQASDQFGIPLKDWIDLSTGINPQAYPVDCLTMTDFQRMPYQSRAFQQAVKHYYGSHGFVALNGTQQVIQLLPKILPDLPVWVPEIGYQEHKHHWAANGNTIHTYAAFDSNLACQSIEKQLQTETAFHLLVINPNNPTGMLFSPAQLLHWAGRLPAGGMLIIDEAFIDVYSGQSILSHCTTDQLPENVLVLRSFGKFFGLAGLRLGFVFAAECWLRRMQGTVGIWDVNGPAQAIAISALRDNDWQQKNRQHLIDRMATDRQIWAPLCDPFAAVQAHNPLFSSYAMGSEQAVEIYEYFARQGILLRVIPLGAGQSLLRMGRLNHSQNIHVQRVANTRDALINTLSIRHTAGATV